MSWKYQPVLNACIQILITVALGTITAACKVFDNAFVPQAVKFVFFVALPCLVISGLGIHVDFSSDSFIWDYIFAYLELRAIALGAAVVVVLVRYRKELSWETLGHMTVVWLSFTWISTVILGIPIMTAVLGSPSKGRFYGLLAAISSFIFQLPLQLLFLEVFALLKSHRAKEPAAPITGVIPELESNVMHRVEGDLLSAATSVHDSSAIIRNLLMRVVWRILLNPVVLSIIAGLIISLTRLGPKYLSEGSSDYVEELGWIDDTLQWLGACVSPVSLFAMGVWMYNEWRRLQEVGLLQILLSMLSKLVLVPLIMVGLVLVMNLNDEASRAAVLIAVLPISQASFSLGSQYKIGEAFLAANVAVGTLLLLPAVLIWNIAMDDLNLFPVVVADEGTSCP